MELFGKFDDTPNCCDQGGYIQHICHQVTSGDPSVYHKNTACHQYHQIHQSVKQLHCGIECRHVTVGQLLNIQKSAVIFLKLDIFHLFIGKCLDHLMAQQTVLEPGVQLSDLVTLLAKGTSHPEIQDHAHTAHKRYT